jgi:hypothetical protein
MTGKPEDMSKVFFRQAFGSLRKSLAGPSEKSGGLLEKFA